MRTIILTFCFSFTLVYAKGISLETYFKSSFSGTVNVGQKSITLSKKDIQQIQSNAKAKLDTKKIRFYVVKEGKKVVGYGVLLVQTIRTKKAAILYMIDKSQTIKNIEILAFNEPSEYKPNKTWQGVFKGKTKEDNLFSGKGIPTISGATLSARAISDAARLALSIVEKYK